MECDICMITWDSDNHIPRLLSCGHTFCEICLTKILRKKYTGNEMQCPTCQASFPNITTDLDIKSLVKNFNLLRIVERIDSRKSIISHVSFNLTKPLNSHYEQCEMKEIDNTYNEYSQAKYMLCKKHNAITHSFAVGTNLTLCDKCVEENKLTSQPLPTIVNDLRTKVNTSLNMIGVYSNEIDRISDFFTSYLDEFEQSNSEKVVGLFAYLNKILQYSYNSAMQIVSQTKSEQKSQIDHRLKELEQLKRELDDTKDELIEYEGIPESEIIKHVKQINTINKKINNFLNYDLEIALLALKIGVKDDFQNILLQTIQDSYYVDVDLTRVNGEMPTLSHILQKEKFWACACGEITNKNSIVKCDGCGNYRKLETLPNLLANPSDVTEFELKVLNDRRKSELADFEAAMLRRPSPKEICYPFYCIEIEWFNHWKAYVKNDASGVIKSKLRISQNNIIGILPPGSVSNINMFDQEKSVECTKESLKLGLEKNKNYLILNQFAWDQILSNYGSNIEITMKGKIDLYMDITKVAYLDNLYKRKQSSAQMITIDEEEEHYAFCNTDQDCKINSQKSKITIVSDVKSVSNQSGPDVENIIISKDSIGSGFRLFTKESEEKIYTPITILTEKCSSYKSIKAQVGKRGEYYSNDDNKNIISPLKHKASPLQDRVAKLRAFNADVDSEERNNYEEKTVKTDLIQLSDIGSENIDDFEEGHAESSPVKVSTFKLQSGCVLKQMPKISPVKPREKRERMNIKKIEKKEDQSQKIIVLNGHEYSQKNIKRDEEDETSKTKMKAMTNSYNKNAITLTKVEVSENKESNISDKVRKFLDF